MGEAEPMKDIQSNVWVSFENKAQVMYCDPASLTLASLKREIQRIQPDCIYINGIYSLTFNLFPLLLRRFAHQIPTVVATRGMLQQGALSVKPFKKKVFLKIFKALQIHRYIRWHATDKQEVEDILTVMGKTVDASLTPVTPDLNIYQQVKLPKSKGMVSMVTISLITAKKNISRLLQDLQNFPLPVQYDIYGPVKDHAYWEQCQSLIQQLPAHIQVRYKGTVKPEEVTSVIQQYHFFVLPTLGENFGHAIYEALNAGRPVIISHKTPWKNLEAQHAGRDFPLEDPKALLNILEECVQMDQAAYDYLCEGAQQVARKFVRESDFLSQYQKLFSF